MSLHFTHEPQADVPVVDSRLYRAIAFGLPLAAALWVIAYQAVRWLLA